MLKDYDIYLDDQKYNHSFDDLTPERMTKRKKWAYSYMDVLCNIKSTINFETATILDIGCKELFTTDYFEEKYNNSITGIDLYSKIFEYAKQNNKTIIDLDAHKLLDVFNAEIFDLIIGLHSFEHMYDIQLVIKNCYTALKRGGYLFCVVPLPSRNIRKGHWADIHDEEHFLERFRNEGFISEFIKVNHNTIRPEKDIMGLFKKE